LNEIILGGDFNVVLDNELDKLNGPPHSNKAARKEILDHLKLMNLVDIFRVLRPQVKQFTRYQKNPFIASRIDYFLFLRSFL